MRKSLSFLIFAILFCAGSLNAQQLSLADIDIKYKDNQEDTSYVIELNQYADVMFDVSIDSSILAYEKAARINAINGRDCMQGTMLSNIGLCYYYQGEYESALSEIKKALDVTKDKCSSSDYAEKLNNYGEIQSIIGNQEEYLKALFEVEKIYESLADSSGLTGAYSNTGSYYYLQDNYETAKRYYLRAIQIAELKNLHVGRVSMYNNLGLTYELTGFKDSSLFYYNKGLDYSIVNEDAHGELTSRMNLASLEDILGKKEASEANYAKALELAELLNIAPKIAEINKNLGRTARENNDYSKAVFHMEKAKLIYDTIGDVQELVQTLEGSSFAYGKLKIYDLAYKDLRRKESLEDSILSAVNEEAMAEMQTKYETDNLKAKQEIDRLTISQEKQKSAQQWYYTLGALVGVALLVGIAFLLLRGNRIKQKANNSLQSAHDKIEKQHDVIQEINQDLTSSIDYAKRLQQAILPTYDYIGEGLKDFFIYFKPRDIVSGDFYWYHKEGDIVVMAVADCTGHGVPGAFVSMTCHNVLNKIIIEDEEYNPAKILSKAHEGIVKIFRKEGAIAQANDGMDVSIVVIDTAKNSLTFAGAMNSLLAVRNGEFVEYKADRRGLGGVAALDYNFTKHEVDLQSKDTFFMYSDGFPDQFGGEKGKKFMSKRFKQMLADSAHKPMQAQKENVWNTFNEWTEEHEQIDDVLVVGFRMS